jgi:hypothetical protein
MSMTELKYDTIEEIKGKQGKTKQYNAKQKKIRKTRQYKIDAI